MKITIYVLDNHLETLYQLLSVDDYEVRGPIKWYHDRPGLDRYFMVTIDYNDYLKLDDR